MNRFGRPKKCIGRKMQSISFDGSELERLKQLAHERSAKTSTKVSICDLVREAVVAHYGGATMMATEVKPMAGSIPAKA